MSFLKKAQVEQFWCDGCITVADAVPAASLARLKQAFDTWVEESKKHSKAFGRMLDGRPRFDVEPGHCATRPALRRIAAPTELSQDYLVVLQRGPLIEMVADLIGPDLRFHHSKVNSKLPGAATTVKWHQDFTFDPHSNDDLITALVFLDDVTSENGPLCVVPGTHRGPLLSLWHEGRFTGALDATLGLEMDKRAVMQTGPAGSVCLMHSRVVHSSEANRTSAARTLYIAAIAAADAVALAPNAVPSIHEGLLLRGTDPGTIRSVAFEMQAPELPAGASFFEQQAMQ